MIKRFRIIGSFILFGVVIFTRFVLPKFFNTIKRFLSKSLSLYSLSFLLVGNPYNYKAVSSTNEIIVKEYVHNRDSIYVKLLSDEVTIPFSGLIIKKMDCLIGVEVAKNIIFYLCVKDSPCLLYESITPETILAHQDSYIIYSNNPKNLDYLNFKVNYNEI